MISVNVLFFLVFVSITSISYIFCSRKIFMVKISKDSLKNEISGNGNLEICVFSVCRFPEDLKLI